MSMQGPNDRPSSVFGMDSRQLDRILVLGLKDPGEDESGTSTLPLHPLLEQPGAQIGRYRLLRVLGEGGMGIVYLAEQREPVKREVALKVIKPGMDSQRVIARFEAEQQALALMEHPHIARVYDAGLAPSGRPFFVMEYVRGIPITEHCDKYKLTIEERLRLFLHVCKAVQHAHQKGIIHRDLKPSNILVVIQDEEMIPKVIDFGVARAISQPLTERTLYTEQGQLIGTPEYMSPEQADPSNQDIDTRTDIYSLGIVLYELLAGVLPFDPGTFRTGGIDHIRKIICEEDPRTPSTRLSKTTPEESRESARCRRTNPQALQRKLQGDLDWITLRAMEKERTRRYATVDALAADIRNYLHHEPVSAAPPAFWYRAGKFVHRHRPALATVGVALVLSLILLGAVQTRIQAGREHARTRELEDERALTEARKLLETHGMPAMGAANSPADALILVKPLTASRYVGPQARLLSASILVEDRRYEEAAAQLEDLCLLSDRPEVAGAAHALLARVIWESQSLGSQKLKRLEEHQQQAERLLPRTAEAYYLRAMTALMIREKLNLLAEALRVDPSHYPSRRLRALTYQASRKYKLLSEDALLMTYARPGDPLGHSLRAIALTELGDFDAAITCYDTAIELTPKQDPQYVKLAGQRCEMLMRMGQYERAIVDAREYLRHVPEAAILHFHTFCALTALGRYEQASDLYRRLVAANPDVRTWSMKYVFDTLETGSSWHPPDRRPEGPAYLPMDIAEEVHRRLSQKAHRLVTDCFGGCWSPDGSRVAFSLGVQGYSGVAIYDLNSQKTELQIVPGKDPSWSPDGRQIAFVRDCEALRLSDLIGADRPVDRAVETEEVWVMGADGTKPRRLARGGGWPSWSPDAQSVYYQSRLEAMLCRISTEERETRPVPVFACSCLYPSVSPTNDSVAYVQGGALCLTDLPSRSRMAEWAFPMPFWGGNWSPDGREFAFGTQLRAGLWIYDVNRNEAAQVLTGPIVAASWSADRKRLLLRLGPPYFEIWVADLDPRLSTAEALAPARSVSEVLQGWIDDANRESAVDPNQLDIQWARAAAALWIGADRASLYLEEMGQAIDRLPASIDTCYWWARNTFARPAVNNQVLPLTLLLVDKVAEKKPAYARDLALTLYSAGQREEATRLWQIGKVNTPDGSCRYDEASETHTVVGFGMDIWDRLDDFHFAFKELHGDGAITARIDDIENVQEWTKAGIMIRASLEPDSPNAMLLVTPTGIVSFQYRREISAFTDQVYAPSHRIQSPYWVRLSRQGNRFTAQCSSDGVTWEDVPSPFGKPATVEIPMGEITYIGLAANSRDATRTAKARFSHVTTIGNISPSGPFVRSLDIPSRLPAWPQPAVPGE